MPTLKRPQIVSFMVILVVLAVLIFFIIKPFVNILALGLIVAILFQPVYQFILKRFKYPAISSLFTIIVLLLIILGPVLFFGRILYTELNHLYNQLSNGSLVLSKDQITQIVPEQYQSFIERFSADINNVIHSLTSNAFSTVSNLVSNIVGFFLGFFLFLISVFFILKDGDGLIETLRGISPIDHDQERVLIDRIISAVNGIVKGQFLMALFQGTMSTIGMFIFGVPSPLLIGSMVVVASLVPNIGTSLVMLPVVAYMLITGHTTSGVGLLIWISIGIGGIDNLIGPKIVGSQLKLHPLLVLLAVIGGIAFFGMLGFLIGPILMAIFVQMLDMYRTDFKKYIHS